MPVGDLRETRGKSPIGVGGFYGLIGRNVTEFNEEAFVILPDFDEVSLWGPCRWQARDDFTLPHKGDQCLVIMDNRRKPWIVAWWPF